MMEKDELSSLMSELHNDIDELTEMQSRLREKKADSDSMFAITKAIWQIKADRDKHLEEFRNGGHDGDKNINITNNGTMNIKL